ncbi:Cytochrome P450 [Canna indica]|uniref:Cytochrome P450 n=1 Tax=Canna indica TaxID=4628 RepID=A0AAQ3QBT5_9LILI|nr:Cytochrome P450 [Canna indica]
MASEKKVRQSDNDSRWSSMRNIITFLYQPSHLANLIPTMQCYINSFFDTITKLQQENNDDIAFSELSLRLAIDVIGKTAFGIGFSLNESSSSKDHLNNIENGSNDNASAFLKQHMYSVTSLKMDLSSSFSTVLGLITPVLQKPCREILRRVPGTADHKLQHSNSV